MGDTIVGDLCVSMLKGQASLVKDITVTGNLGWFYPCNCPKRHDHAEWSKMISVGIKDTTPLTRWSKVALFNYKRNLM
jgi:hypothetical protein